MVNNMQMHTTTFQIVMLASEGLEFAVDGRISH